ncbi:hypothetical protein ACIRQP_37465 [Streptomyces sp. NPDC102274]|uniref:hypothetical protein n=1 Tax=Streptomyces sp. NPDC102274 TaxID=3366151 RepID=UPI0037FA00F6
MKVTTPRPCATCRAKPVATNRSRYCFDCRPGGPYAPPPCRRCGTTENYYSAGLCFWCHPGRPTIASSCPDCLAWGVYQHSRGICLACRMFRKRHPDRGACRICRHTAALWDCACRLCRRQAALAERERGTKARMDLEDGNRKGQQLYFGDMDRRVGLSVPIETRQQHRAALRARSASPRPVEPVTHRQLLLFEVRRDLKAGQRRGFPEPTDAVLAAALDQRAVEYRQRLGWNTQLDWAVRRSLRILLGTQDTPGAPIKATAVVQLREVNLPARHALAILAEADFLEDDRPNTLEMWFHAETAALPADMAAEVHVWFTAIHHGSRKPPRSRPIGHTAVRHYVRCVLPMLRAWSANHASLRSITRNEVLDVLPDAGWQRHDGITAVRSLFRTLKRHQMIFQNPAARISQERNTGIPQPVDRDAIADTLNDRNPVRAALGALVAFHALTVTDLRHLLLTDVQDGRLRRGDRTILLAAPVRARLTAYLDLRVRKWPTTANAHLFINAQTANHTGPTSNVWATKILGLSAQALREDRILDELVATGDVRRLCDLFGLSIAGAERYRVALDPPGLATEGS